MKNEKQKLLKKEKHRDQIWKLETNMFNSKVHRTTLMRKEHKKNTKSKEFRGSWEFVLYVYA